MKQIIISIGREFGSGGHVVAEKLAKHYEITYYNDQFLKEVAKEGNFAEEVVEKYDEKPMNFALASMALGNGGMSLEQDIAIKQFNVLKEKAEKGESFVVVGRCADEILSEYDCMTSVFVLSDMDSKVNRIMDREGLSEKEAINKMKKMDKMRKMYHNFYCESKWGDSRTYDICVKTNNKNIDIVVDMIIKYIDGK